MKKKAKKQHSKQTNPNFQLGIVSSGRTDYLWPVLVAFVIAGVPFAAGKYIEFNTAGPYDSGAFVYSAAHVLDGAKMGIEELPTAKIGTLLTNMAGVWVWGYSETGPKIIQSLLQISALAMMFVSIFRAAGPLAAVFSVSLASLFLSAPLIAGFGNIKEQYMIAFMVMAASCYVMGALTEQTRWIIAAGALIVLPPMFKSTGTSIQVALGLFVLFQALAGGRSWRQTLKDIGCLCFGAAIPFGMVCLWLWSSVAPKELYPYYFVWRMLAAGTVSSVVEVGYISNSREIVGFSEQAARVFLYYRLLVLPIGLACCSIAFYLVALLKTRLSTISGKAMESNDRCHTIAGFVPFFAVWWILDMAYVWISPRSYPQYYLPFISSSAMLSSYLACLYEKGFRQSKKRRAWVIFGFVMLAVLIGFSWDVITGTRISTITGERYENKSRGFISELKAIKNKMDHKVNSPWMEAGYYVREHSRTNDKIYVWGWIPGIYVKAQRFSPTAKSFTSEMHVKSPEDLSKYIGMLMNDFKKEPPIFIIDPHKKHFPWDRPPLELWPSVRGKLLLNRPEYIARYETAYAEELGQTIGEEEAKRFQAMKPFRDYVMENYLPVKRFGAIVVFKQRN